MDVSNPEIERFYTLLDAANRPLWEGCVHLEFSLNIRMLSIKSKVNQSQCLFD